MNMESFLHNNNIFLITYITFFPMILTFPTKLSPPLPPHLCLLPLAQHIYNKVSEFIDEIHYLYPANKYILPYCKYQADKCIAFLKSKIIC